MTTSELSTFRTGDVVWVDLSTSDVDRSTGFYERLFGWRLESSTIDDASYVLASLPDGPVGGMMAQSPDEVSGGAPPAWSVLIRAEQLDPVVEAVGRLGGTVLQPPMRIPTGARLAVIADPAGAALALIEAQPAELSMVRDEPGSICWVECLSRDRAASRRFHEQLLGWTSDETPEGYVVFEHNGEAVAGLMDMPGTVPAGVPSYWLVYFAVDDVARAAALAVELGGNVLEPVHAIAEGRFAVVEDPVGAVFALFEATPAEIAPEHDAAPVPDDRRTS